MSTFIEFQKTILDKLCLIENRLSNIEAHLRISENTISEPIAESEQTVVDIIPECSENALKDEISDFQKQLNDIKSLFE